MNINLGNDYSSFELFNNDIIRSEFEIPESWTREIKIISRYGYYDELNNVGWVVQKKGNGTIAKPYKRVFYAIKNGHTTRVDYSTLKNRLDSNNDPWYGHVEWNLG